MKKILIVDDSAFFRGLLREELLNNMAQFKDEEFSVIEADDTQSALERVQNENPTLVFLDVVMKDSELEGVNILQKIKKLQPDQNVVMLTSVGQLSVVQKCKSLGAKDYLEKPFDKTGLINIVKKYLD